MANYRQALFLKPGFAEAYNNLGLALQGQRKLDEAMANFRQAVLLKPDFAERTFTSPCPGFSGRLSEGWPEFEWRWQANYMKSGLRNFRQPLWQGNSLRNATILLHAEQGLGDTIQFIRFAALVKERIGNVLCECPAVLVRLLQSCADIDKVIPFGEPLPPFDVHAPLMSLPGIFKTTLATIPANIPYLHANTTLTEAQTRVPGSSKDFKIGVVWQGRSKSGTRTQTHR